MYIRDEEVMIFRFLKYTVKKIKFRPLINIKHQHLFFLVI